MSRFFLSIYRFFARKRALMYILLVLSFGVFAWFGLQIRLDENIATLLPRIDTSDKCAVAFRNIRVKDKVFVQIHAADGAALAPDSLAAAMDEYITLLGEKDGEGLVENSLYRLDEDDMNNFLYYAMSFLPCHLDSTFYPALDTLLTEKYIDSVMRGDVFSAALPDLGGFTLVDGHLFSPDSTVALAFLSPGFDALETKVCHRMEKMLSQAAAELQKARPEVEVLCHGTPIEGSFNSWQIKKDLIFTVGLSLLVICIVIWICFRSASTLPNLLMPVAYGTLCALSCMFWIKGSMSLIALGIGVIILGVAISYCLHVLTHYKFVGDVERMIAEQARPICLGCLTTIGAFLGLMFTSSELLHDFGLFASIALVSTTLFALIFLPHFFREGDTRKNEAAFSLVNRINSYPLDRNKPVVVLLLVFIGVSLANAHRVGFDNDLNNIGYKEPKMIRSEQLYNAKVNGGHFNMYYAANAEDLDDAILISRRLSDVLDSLKGKGLLYSFTTPEGLLVPLSEQQENIDRWQQYWTMERTASTYRMLRRCARRYGWSESTQMDIPETFRAMARADYEPTTLYEAGVLPEGLLANFVENTPDGWLVFTGVLMDEGNARAVSDAVAGLDGVIVLDPFYYTGDMVEIVHSDFSIVLLISSLFVFLVLLLSMRNPVTTLIAFMPMGLSWYIVQGVMAMIGVKFNLVNIMISTFIFGIGVDYSIFVMDGLISKARFGTYRLLTCHKAAIFFSGFVLLVVIGSLLFARHPAIFSIGVSTIIGMTATILITYALQPLLFRGAMKWKWYRNAILEHSRK